MGEWLVGLMSLMQRFGGMIEVNLSETVIDAFSSTVSLLKRHRQRRNILFHDSLDKNQQMRRMQLMHESASSSFPIVIISRRRRRHAAPFVVWINAKLIQF